MKHRRDIEMVNVSKLLGIIREKCTTQEGIACNIGVSRSTFCRKLKKAESFSVDEVSKMATALRLSDQDIILIFFAS